MGRFMKTGAAIALTATVALTGGALARGGFGGGGGFGGFTDLGYGDGFTPGGYGDGFAGGASNGVGVYGGDAGFIGNALNGNPPQGGTAAPTGFAGAQPGTNGGVRTGRSAAVAGGSCETPVKSCQLFRPSYAGASCSCRVPGGRAHGRVTP